MVRLLLDISRRYLIGKKSANIINIITAISVFGIAIGTAALILILSVFNGFELLLTSLFNPFNPDLKVETVEGKFFNISDEQLAQIYSINGVESVSKSIEEIALFDYKGSQELGIIKGVDDAFVQVTQIDTAINFGRFLIKKDKVNYAVVEEGIRNKLGLNIENKSVPVKVYMPSTKKKMFGAKEFVTKSFYPTGIFSKSNDDNNQYIITNIALVQSLIEKKNLYSALEIKLGSGADIESLKPEMQNILGDGLIIKNRFEQDEVILKTMKVEKWIFFLITGLTIFLIVVNLVAALWMLVLDKRRDISIFKSFGFTKRDINNIFLFLGVFITLIGIILGFLLALLLYYIQKEYGLIGLSDGFMIDAYPVQLRWTDFIIVTLTVLFIGFLASIIPSNKASNQEITLRST